MNTTIIKVSIQNLIEYIFLSGDINSGFIGSSRMTEGIKGHRIVQQSSEENYQAEVPLAITLERKGLVLELNGRADGIFKLEDRIFIEEIKTTRQRLIDIKQDFNPAHWAQVKCYAYIFGKQKDLDTIGIRLTYYQSDAEEKKSFQKLIAISELEESFYQLIDEYLYWMLIVEKWVKKRNHSIKQLKFPFVNYRKGQRELAVAVYKTIVENKKLFVQAPTGIGKTIATLFPAVKAVNEGQASKVFYLTAKTITRTAAEKAYKQMRAKGLAFKTVTITAKEKICFQDEAICNPEYCEFAHGHFDRIKAAIADIFQHDSFSRTLIEEYARKHLVCPFEFSLDLANWSDGIICDYNYIFDPRVYLKRFFLDPKNEYIFLIDEAHNLVDRAREMFSAELIKRPILDLKRKTKEVAPRLSQILNHLNQFLIQARKLCETDKRRYYLQKEQPVELQPVLNDFINTTEEWLGYNHDSPLFEELLNLYFDVKRFIRTLEFYDERYVTYFEKHKNDLKMKLFCLDPAKLLSEIMNKAQGVTLFSATLTPLGYFAQILGGEEDFYQLDLTSCFPRENLCLLVADRVSTKFRERELTYAVVTEYISTVISIKKGNYLIFLPSYQYLNEILIRFTEMNPEIRVIVQKSGMLEIEREDFLHQFSSLNEETLVGFAVMGGIFGEGIDLEGKRLSGAVIVGVGLPKLSLERDIIADYFMALNSRGFEYAYVYPGMNRVLQAVGRVIRTETDRGVVLLIDERFSTFRYKKLFPKHWLPHPVVRDCSSLATKIRQFWSEDSV